MQRRFGEENPSYFFCQRRHVPELVKRAKTEAAAILKEFSLYYQAAGTLEIVIEPIQHVTCWSIGATLTWDGQPVKKEDSADLLFLELNELMLKRLIECRRA